MRTIDTAIDIDAPPDAVWAVVADFATYPDWNPFMISIAGDLVPGARLGVTMQNPGGKPTKFRPTVLPAEPRQLRWIGHVLVRGIFDGAHEIRVDATEHGSRFVQREEFSGILLPLIWRTLNTKTRAGFEAMNEALKGARHGFTNRLTSQWNELFALTANQVLRMYFADVKYGGKPHLFVAATYPDEPEDADSFGTEGESIFKTVRVPAAPA